MLALRQRIVEATTIAVGLAAISVLVLGVYFACYLLVYFILLRTAGTPQKLATGIAGTALLLYLPLILSSAVSTWTLFRISAQLDRVIFDRVVAALCISPVAVGALILLPRAISDQSGL